MKHSRRECVRMLAGSVPVAAAGALLGCGTSPRDADGAWLNDVHSGLNRTRAARVLRPGETDDLVTIVKDAQVRGAPVSISGGRHAMGGQQFATGADHIDMRGMNRVVSLDRERGLVEVEAGIEWPDLYAYLGRAQGDVPWAWGVRQKQTGADRLSLGGALAANVHGRGLRNRPIVQDVESFTLVDADGRLRRCSRTENAVLFGLAIGGYGLFGVVATVTLRLERRQKIQRVVEEKDIGGIAEIFDARIAEGYVYGDFQFAIDPRSDEFLRRGVLTCYRPVADATPVPAGQLQLSAEAWGKLLVLAHTDKARAYESYAAHYRATSGQIYWSDTHQLSLYLDGYHAVVDAAIGARVPGSEMITEIYVPRRRLARFMDRVRADFLRHDVGFVYGTVRLVERDDETFLAWAREPWACIIFNLHVDHDPAGLARAQADFRRLIERSIAEGGSYYLTYHRWAERRQVDACYPQFAEFLRRKRAFDPQERFQSEWYRHYREMFQRAA